MVDTSEGELLKFYVRPTEFFRKGEVFKSLEHRSDPKQRHSILFPHNLFAKSIAALF